MRDTDRRREIQPARPILAYLSSWRDTAAKRAILDFVARVSRRGEPGFVPAEERIAVFDSDGTLWPEEPLIEGHFALTRLERAVERNPTLRERQPFRAALRAGLDYVAEAGPAAMLELLAKTHANLSQEQIDAEVRAFVETEVHPRLGVPYRHAAYRPMVELIDYLRAHGFTPWICSAGACDLIRILAQRLYGIPPQQVIGSTFQMAYVEREGEPLVWRQQEIAVYNDHAMKPVKIALQIGRRPLLAAGSVRFGGDVQMLRYSQGRPAPSFQMLIHHDDAERETAYEERDRVSLAAAAHHGWTVVSLKKDWKSIFDETVRGHATKVQ